MEQGIITLEDSCKKFILDLIVPYDESYNLKKEEGELFEIDELIREYSNNFIDSIKLKILKPKIMSNIDFMYLDLDKDLNHKYYLKPLEEKNVTLRNIWIDLKKEYITHYLMMCNFNPPEAYFRTGELQQENFYYSILSKDKDSNKITGKVFRYYFAKKCLDTRQNTVIGRYSKPKKKMTLKKINDVFKSCSLHVYHRFELITPSKEELESLRNIRSHSILSMVLSPNIRHHYHYSKVTFNGEKLTEKARFCKVFI